MSLPFRRILAQTSAHFRAGDFRKPDVQNGKLRQLTSYRSIVHIFDPVDGFGAINKGDAFDAPHLEHGQKDVVNIRLVFNNHPG